MFASPRNARDGTAAVPPPRLRGARLAGWIGMAVLSTGVAAVSYRYVVPTGAMPPNIVVNRFVRPWIAVHAGGAATALLVGAWQLLPGLRARSPRLHRWLGRAYVLGCGAGGIGAMMLTAGTVAGPFAATGFLTLDGLWLLTTGLGTVAAIRGRFAAHRRWMIRSASLTFGAVLLRVYLPIAVVGFGADFMTAYRLVAWLSWLPNIVAVEVYLHRKTGAGMVPIGATA